jgi:hypothetical protein
MNEKMALRIYFLAQHCGNWCREENERFLTVWQVGLQFRRGGSVRTYPIFFQIWRVSLLNQERRLTYEIYPPALGELRPETNG